MKPAILLSSSSAAAILALGALCVLLRERPLARGAEPRPEPRSDSTALAALRPASERVPCAGEPPAARTSGFYALPEGRSLEMRFRCAFATDLVQAGVERGARIAIELEGTLSVLVLEATEQGLVLRALLDLERAEASTSAGQTPPDYRAALAEELARPALVRMQGSGRILGYHFDPDARDETRNLVKTLWSALRCAIERDEGQWLVEEADSTGSCLVECAWLDAAGASARRIAKAKLAYQEPGAPRIASSRGEARMSLQLRWPLEARYTERAELALDEADGTLVRVATEVHFTLVRAGMVARASMPRLDPRLAWESAGASAGSARSGPGRLPRELAMAADTTSLEEIIATIESELAAGFLESSALHDAQRILAELIRRDARCMERLSSFLPGLEPETSMVVLAAVGLAGTTEAQAFLAGILGDDGGLEHLRISANLSTHQIERPTLALIEALARLVVVAESPRNVRSSARLALGDLASRAAPELREAVLAQLLDRPGSDASSDDLVVWLEALGNSASPRIVPALTDYLGHADERVRASAVSALRLLEPGAGAELLIAALLDSSPRVRTSAAEQLALRASPEAGPALARYLAAESSVLARRRTVAALGQRQQLDEATRALLGQVLAADPDAAIRELALRILERS